MPSPFAKLSPKRRRLFLILGCVIGAAAFIWLLYWFFIGSHEISTDDAYVAADSALVTPSVGGIVKTVDVVDTQTVAAGQVLATLDDIDTKLAFARANADLASANAAMERAEIDLKRRQSLAASGSVSGEELTNAQSAYIAAQATQAAADAAKHQAEIDLQRTTISAPIAGTIAQRQVQIGQKVAPGTALMRVVPLGQAYVNANYKEVQLRKVKIGQKAEMTSDLYGSSIVYHGTVTGIAGGTGSAFSIIPAQNATGNWIKVVQRLPVRISLNPDDLAKHPLQVGLSMQATIYLP